MTDTFSEHYRTLERIAQSLEDGEADLDTVLPLIQEATAAYQACKSRLESVRRVLDQSPVPERTLAATLDDDENDQNNENDEDEDLEGDQDQD